MKNTSTPHKMFVGVSVLQTFIVVAAFVLATGIQQNAMSAAELSESPQQAIAELKKLRVPAEEGSIEQPGFTVQGIAVQLPAGPVQSEGTIKDAVLPHLRNLPNLMLISDHTSFGDAGMGQLAGMKNIQMLLLAGTKVTDAGLRHLTSLSSIKFLSLRENDITDAGLESL